MSGPPATVSSLHDPRVRAASRQRLARRHDIVESHRLIANHLIFLVALASEEHDIARPRQLDRLRDRLAAIHERQQPAPTLTPRLRRHTATDLVDDAAGILATWVVRRHDDEVAQSIRHSAHQRTFCSIPFSAAAEQRDQATTY